jgi:hypothetical protein
MSKLTKALWGIATVSSIGVALFSYRYLGPPNVTESPGVLANLFARPWLLVHVAGAATALLVVGFQLLPGLRRRRTLHRWLGRIYATGCLAGGAGGLLLAFGTTAGAFAGWGFGTLAVTWIFVTTQGWLTARTRRYGLHREWMIRSFSLTFGAVMLRVYLPLGMMAGLSFEQVYPLTAWISWVPNLMIAEYYLHRGRAPVLQPAE